MIGLRPLTWQIYIDSRTGRGYTPSVHTETLSQHPALKQHTTLHLQNGLFDYNTATSVQQYLGGSQHVSCDEMEILRPAIEE
ncbi:hypothetical protein E2C01_032335 [Portunus trituberculatus]|uniref:Uncharacterized protein n=1 Tax=Portunus trituberculatus TaxID=210409 RepID=A0A5B7F0T3_PORTR|nr:hypothetical protein [Portunus trituberculatus]